VSAGLPWWGAIGSKASRPHRLRRWLARLLLVAVAGTVVPVVGLRWIPPPTSSVMLQHRLAALLRTTPRPAVRYRWSPWSAIAPAMRLAVVAAEDQKFAGHWGFDLASIADAIEDAAGHRRLRGASTITQQVARNLFLWQGRSWPRKALEAYFTVLLEACWPKRRILEVYLNIAQFGDGTYGVGAASQAFFGKRPGALLPAEAALLAAVLPNPVRLQVRRPSSYVRARAAWIEEQMALLGGPAYLKNL
jgi:monofunctional biosynthetic peptidoglycan transglycosylase